MMHYVIAEVDRGEPIMVREVQCREGESLEDLESRMHAVEHQIIVEATTQVAAQVAGARRSRGT